MIVNWRYAREPFVENQWLVHPGRMRSAVSLRTAGCSVKIRPTEEVSHVSNTGSGF
mgnify:CR=1 FL=1